MNETIFFFFHNLSNQSAFFDGIVVFFANYFQYMVVIGAFVFLLFYHQVLPSENPIKEFVKKWKAVFSVFFTSATAWVLARILKILINTERPFAALGDTTPLFLDHSPSMPSGHATFFMALAVSIFFYNKKIGYLFIFCALIISVARIIAGVHFPSDILGGFVLGAVIAYFVQKI